MSWARGEKSTRLESKVNLALPVSIHGGCWILTQTVLGSEVLVTRDPENVKAIYATHASSFEIGASRYVSGTIASARYPLPSRKTYLAGPSLFARYVIQDLAEKKHG